MGENRRIAILGGGISGLAAAYEIATRHEEASFTLYEASGRLGGTVETVHQDGFTIECGPDSWVTEKPWARNLALELGLADEIIPSNDFQRVTYLVQGGRLVPMPAGMRMMVPYAWEPLLDSPLLTPQAKQNYQHEAWRAEELKASAVARRGEDADESVAAFTIRHFGEEATRMLAGPLLAGVFGGDIDKLSVRAVMAPFVRMEADTGSLVEAVRARAAASAPGASVFTSLKSGLGTLIQRLVDALPASSIRLKQTVTAIITNGWQWSVRTATGETAEYDAVLVALPAAATRALLSSLQQTVADEISNLLPTESSSAVCAAIGYHPQNAARLKIPRGFGFLVPTAGNSKVSLLAATFVDQKFPHRVPEGGSLLRGFFGGHVAEELHDAADTTVVEETRRQLSLLLGPLPEPDVAVVRHWPRSLPQYLVGHMSRMRRMEPLLEGLPNLRLLGNSYHGVGLPDLVRDARAAANAIVSVRTVEAIP